MEQKPDQPFVLGGCLYANGDGDVMWTKCESVENHIHNVQECHIDVFPTCAHETLDWDQRQKKWIKTDQARNESQ